MSIASTIFGAILVASVSLQLACVEPRSNASEARKRNAGAGKEVEQPDGIAGYIIGPERFGFEPDDSRLASEIRQPNMRDFSGSFVWPIANFRAEQAYVVAAFDPGKVDPEEFVAQISDTSRDCNHRFTYDSFYVDADAGVVVIQPTSERAKFAAFLVVTALPEDACYQSYYDSVSIALTGSFDNGPEATGEILLTSNATGVWQTETLFTNAYAIDGLAMTRLSGTKRKAIAFYGNIYEQQQDGAWARNAAGQMLTDHVSTLQEFASLPVNGQETLFAVECCAGNGWLSPDAAMIKRTGNLGTFVPVNLFAHDVIPHGIRVQEHGLLSVILFRHIDVELAVADLTVTGPLDWDVKLTITSDGEGRDCSVETSSVATTSTADGSVFYTYACADQGGEKTLNVGVHRSSGYHSGPKTVQNSFSYDMHSEFAPEMYVATDGVLHLVYLPWEASAASVLWYARLNVDNTVIVERFDLKGMENSEILINAKKLQIDEIGNGAIRIFYYAQGSTAASGQLMTGILAPGTGEMFVQPVVSGESRAPVMSRVVRN